MCLTRKQQHQRQDQLELRYSCLQTVTITTPFNSVPICIIIKNCTCQVHIRSSALSVVQLVDPFFDGFKVVNSPVLIPRHTHLNIIITYIPLNSQINSNPDAQKKKYNLAQRTHNRWVDEQIKSISARTTDDYPPIVARVTLFLPQNRWPFVVSGNPSRVICLTNLTNSS